jgi:plasmid stabilization system protein ParE
MDKNPNDSSSMSSDPWVSIRENFSYVGNILDLTRNLLRRLVDASILTWTDYEKLTPPCAPASMDDRIDILVHILRHQAPHRFAVFCSILRDEGQTDVAQRLMGSEVAEMIVGEAVVWTYGTAAEVVYVMFVFTS